MERQVWAPFEPRVVFTIAQSPDTCIVESMPRSAIERGFAMRIVPLQNVASALQSICAPEPQLLGLRAAQRRRTLLRKQSQREGEFYEAIRTINAEEGSPIGALPYCGMIPSLREKPWRKWWKAFGGEVAGEAGDGCTAITEYARTNPDIVLMDITMPQMEGIEAVERIVQEHPDARVIMVSSVGYQDNILAALQKGARSLHSEACKARGALRNCPLRP